MVQFHFHVIDTCLDELCLGIVQFFPFVAFALAHSLHWLFFELGVGGNFIQVDWRNGRERERETRKWLIFGIDFAVHGFVFFSKVKKAWANSEIRNEEIKRKERG